MPDLEVIFHEKYLDYSFGESHPFRPKRAKVFLDVLKEEDVPHKVLEPKKASDEDIALAHNKDYLERVKRLAKEGGSLAPDTPVKKEALEASYFSVGGSILAAKEALKDKRAVNLLGGMHHAGISDSSGFCIFNDHAVAIKKLQKEKKAEKVLVLDLDVHAGQGTQEIFYKDPTVFTVSIHQNPNTLYPGTGFPWQRGEGEGEGYNLNLILERGTKDTEYLQILDLALEKVEGFGQDLTFLVLGVDTYEEDPLAGINLSEDAYTKIGERVKGFENMAVLFAGGYSKRTPYLWFKFLEGLLG